MSSNDTALVDLLPTWICAEATPWLFVRRLQEQGYAKPRPFPTLDEHPCCHRNKTPTELLFVQLTPELADKDAARVEADYPWYELEMCCDCENERMELVHAYGKTFERQQKFRPSNRRLYRDGLVGGAASMAELRPTRTVVHLDSWLADERGGPDAFEALLKQHGYTVCAWSKRMPCDKCLAAKQADSCVFYQKVLRCFICTSRDVHPLTMEHDVVWRRLEMCSDCLSAYLDNMCCRNARAFENGKHVFRIYNGFKPLYRELQPDAILEIGSRDLVVASLLHHEAAGAEDAGEAIRDLVPNCLAGLVLHVVGQHTRLLEHRGGQTL